MMIGISVGAGVDASIPVVEVVQAGEDRIARKGENHEQQIRSMPLAAGTTPTIHGGVGPSVIRSCAIRVYPSWTQGSRVVRALGDGRAARSVALGAARHSHVR